MGHLGQSGRAVILAIMGTVGVYHSEWRKSWTVRHVRRGYLQFDGLRVEEEHPERNK